MAASKLFPHIKPSSRSFSPGVFPEKEFEAVNGAKTFIRYGNKRVNAQLSLTFSNITEEQAVLILDNYVEVAMDPDNWVTFSHNDILHGMNSLLQPYVRGHDAGYYAKSGGLRWRYEGSPTVVGAYRGLSNVSCKFVACLKGA